MTPEALRMFALNTAVPGTQIRVGVGVLILDSEGRFLIEKRADCGMWGLLGGRVEPGESIEHAAKREVLEESGLHIKITGLIGIYSQPDHRIAVYPDNGDVRHLIDIVLEAQITGGSLLHSPESEKIEFFAAANLPPDSEVIPPARQPLADALAGRRSVLN